MTRGVEEPDGPKYLRNSSPFTFNPAPITDPLSCLLRIQK